MHNKLVPLFSICILFILLAVLSHADGNQNPSPFDFIKHLQGCHKGSKVKGINDLKTYLQRFGYLNKYNTNNANANHDEDDFDDLLESAIKTYQANYHLKPTGELDANTVSQMMMPRCGVPDIVNRTTTTTGGKKKHRRDPFHTVSHYTFFTGSPKWSKTHLTYTFLPGTPEAAKSPVAGAFAQWASSTPFTFSEAQPNTKADITIDFRKGDHGDGGTNSIFDGPGGTIAHAFSPPDGRFHYDSDETYAVGATPGAFDYETVALHEIGHLLGLDHEPGISEAIMYPSISRGVTKGLNQDDINGIRALYS